MPVTDPLILETKKDSSVPPPTILSFANDLPNICSLVGLLSAVFAIYFAIVGNFPAAMIGLLWATFFDWGDGLIARRMKSRSKTQGEFGGQLDSLIDIVTYAVCPAIVLLSYGGFSPWFIPGAFFILAAAALRLSYYNVFGLSESATYQGLAMDNNVLILAMVFVIEYFVDASVFTTLLYTVLVVLAILNVSPITTTKLAGKWYYIITVYILLLTSFYGWQLLKTS
jgi:CDP-diacylglycerol--serine O-phosphatidyltransferase